MTTSIVPTDPAASGSDGRTLTGRSGVRLCYDTFGDPSDPPLVLIQGLGAQMIGWHPEFCETLAAAGFHVIRHDNRDAGRSDHFPSGDYTVMDMARDTAELLDALGVASAHVVGQSMGGMIAQQVVIDRPDLVRSLGLLYSSAHTGHIRTDAVDGRRDLPTARDRAEAVELYVLNETPCASARYPHDESWIRLLGGLMYDRDYEPAALERQYGAINASPDRSAALRSVRVPTVVVHGDLDQLIAPEAAIELRTLIPGAELTIYPGMGHSLPRPLWDDIVSRLAANARRDWAGG